MPLLVQFIVFAVVAAIGLWAIAQFPADGTIVKLIRMVVIVVLALMALNLILMLI